MHELIPERIVQIWGGGSQLSMLSKAAQANARLLNPGYEYCFYDDERIEAFVAEHFPQYAETMRSFRFPIQRYDFLRYLIIYRFGGFYFDLDLLLVSGLSGLVGSGCVFPFERLAWATYPPTRHAMDWEVGNYAFGASAGHPFLGAVIANCIRAQKDRAWLDEVLRTLPWILREELFVIYSTGPGLVSRTLGEYSRAGGRIEVLFPDDVTDRRTWNRFGDYGVHLREQSWRKPRNSIRRRLVSFVERRIEQRAIDRARTAGRERSIAIESGQTA